MRPQLQFRLQAGLAQTPLWLAGAACLSLVLFLNVAAGLRASRAAEPVVMHAPTAASHIQLASFGGLASEVRLLEMGAPTAAAAPSFPVPTRDWVNLIGAAALSVLLSIATLRRLLLLD